MKSIDFNQETKAIKWIKKQSSTNGAEKLDIHMKKKHTKNLNLNLCLTLYTKTNLKWIPDLNVKLQNFQKKI